MSVVDTFAVTNNRLVPIIVWLTEMLTLLRKNPLFNFLAVFQDSTQLVHTIVLDLYFSLPGSLLAFL